jgi:hypothetical protein
VDLVLLPFEPGKEAANPLVLFAVSLDDQPLLRLVQIHPGDREPHAVLASRPLQIDEVRPIVRPVPRLDGILLNRLCRVRYDEPHVELDDVAEAVAGRAGAKRIVEREEPRLRILVRNAAGTAFEAFAEDVEPLSPASLRIWPFQREGRAAAFPVGRLDGVGQPRADVASDDEAVDNDLERRPVSQAHRTVLVGWLLAPGPWPLIDVFERHRPSVSQQSDRKSVV